MASSSLDDLEGPIGVDGRSIPIWNGQHIIDLRHVDHPGEQGNLGARKAIGIARTIPALVVVANCRRDIIETGSGNNLLADHRVFPAIKVADSGTRRDDRLYSETELAAVNKIRSRAVDLPPRQAIEDLLKLLEQYPTNEALLKSMK